MKIEFDPNKDIKNQASHGVSMVVARELAWQEGLIWVDDRRDYGETRYSALVPRGDRLYFVAFTDRGEVRRIISLRKANSREVARYVKS